MFEADENECEYTVNDLLNNPNLMIEAICSKCKKEALSHDDTNTNVKKRCVDTLFEDDLATSIQPSKFVCRPTAATSTSTSSANLFEEMMVMICLINT